MTWTRTVLARATVVFTDRTGGVSSGSYASANLSDRVGDDPARVAENRQRARTALIGAGATAAERAGSPGRVGGVWIGAAFRHGADVTLIDDDAVERHRRGLAPDDLPPVDALVTSCPEAILVMLGGDCAPVALMADRAVAAAHVGWRGLTAGVLDTAVDALRSASPGGVRAIVGPTIGPCCYEFGLDDLERVSRRIGPHVRSSTSRGTPALDLPGGIRSELARAGVDDVDELGVCTACSPRHFSHRRDGQTGRQAVLVRLASEPTP